MIKYELSLQLLWDEKCPQHRIVKALLPANLALFNGITVNSATSYNGENYGFALTKITQFWLGLQP